MLNELKSDFKKRVVPAWLHSKNQAGALRSKGLGLRELVTGEVPQRGRMRGLR